MSYTIGFLLIFMLAIQTGVIMLLVSEIRALKVGQATVPARKGE